MGLPILVLGRSGSGKSRSLKEFSDKDIITMKAVNKVMPFKANFKNAFVPNYTTIKQVLAKGEYPSYCIDDAGYLMTHEFMAKKDEKGYDKFTNLAFNFYDLINFVTNQMPEDKIVYILMHEEEDPVLGTSKPKTIGKLLDEKICVEGMFTIVLRCVYDGEKHLFYTNNSGCAKSPEDMFESDTIENNLKLVDNTIREYYNL